MTSSSLRRAVVVGALAAGAYGLTTSSRAEGFHPGDPMNVVVRGGAGGWPTVRGEGSRRGGTRSTIPERAFAVAYRTSTNGRLDVPPLVAPDGSVTFVSRRAEVVTLDPEGHERAKVAVGGTNLGAATLRNDGTFVLTVDRDVVGVRAGRVVFRTPILESTSPSRAAPLALEDGSVLVAGGTSLVHVGVDGAMRARTLLRLPTKVPIVATPDGALVVDDGGNVFRWMPGRDAERLGSFDGPIDGVAVHDGNGGLLATTRGTRLVRFDLASRELVTMATSGGGVFVSPPVLAPRELAVLLLSPPGRTEFVTWTWSAGREALGDARRVTVETSAAVGADGFAADGGLSTLATLTLRGSLIVDDRGRHAFAAPGGTLGVVASDFTVESWSESACGPSTSRGTAGFLGPISAGTDRLLIACDAGRVLVLRGTSGDGRRD